jgi:glycosyltransferase involved in cell wall biosynthesis
VTAESSLSESSIVILGPVHPLGGGVAQHVARLAIELEETYRASIRVESWKSQYPTSLHRSQVTVPESSPEVPLSVAVVRKLKWYSPLSWASAGLRSRKSGAVLFNVVTPFHALPLAVFRLFLEPTATTVGIVHNALPHERSPFDRILLRLLARTCDAFIVHDGESEALLKNLTRRRKTVITARLPNPWSSTTLQGKIQQVPRINSGLTHVSALFFGNVRPYKGLDVLLDALRSVPEAGLTIAGNFWEQEAAIAQTVEDCGLTRQVILKPGYVDKKDIPNLFCQADVVVLPYLSGTASVIPQIAFSYGVPVIVTDVGSVAAGVEDGVNGLVVGPNNSQELARAISAFAQRFDLRERLTLGARASRLDDGWGRYVKAVVKLVENVGS